MRSYFSSLRSLPIVSCISGKCSTPVVSAAIVFFSFLLWRAPGDLFLSAAAASPVGDLSSAGMSTAMSASSAASSCALAAGSVSCRAHLFAAGDSSSHGDVGDVLAAARELLLQVLLPALVVGPLRAAGDPATGHYCFICNGTDDAK